MESLSWRSPPISLDNLDRFPIPDSLGELGRHGKFEGGTNKVKLTDWGIQSLKPNPNGKRYMVWDTAMQHLAVGDPGPPGCRISPRLRPLPSSA
jgi:hypothetical protein